MLETVPYHFPKCLLTYIRSDDEEDETAELMRELEKIKRERAEQREREVSWKSVEATKTTNSDTGTRTSSKGARATGG